jgi:hypothetical protein
MAGSLLQAARADAKRYIQAGGFEETIVLTTPAGDASIETTGFATKHHINFDTDGTTMNAKNAHICVDENFLADNGYPVRVNEEVNLLNHRVSFPDSSGVQKEYIVKENFPDETLGLIVCILGDFQGQGR